MTATEKNSIIKLCIFAVVSICAGLWYVIGLPDIAFFIGNHIAEMVLLFTLRDIFSHFKFKSAKIISTALILLSVGEMLDEILGNNISFRINDYVLLLVTIIVTYKLLKSDGRHKT